MLMGSAADEKEIEDYKKEVLVNPREFIAQPSSVYPAALVIWTAR